ncbi:MAG: LysR family transcriptional regulator, partial [Proteobacteria bacterium]|nr:LysR family transcriptional regulator [Pseudomonadota bacterium]
MASTLPNLRHLQLLLEAQRRGSISAAARAAHLSQPAVTQAIAAVERWFGGELLRRGSLGLQASAAGQAALARIERTLGLLREGLAGLRAAANQSLRDITSAQLLALTQMAGQGSFAAAAA